MPDLAASCLDIGADRNAGDLTYLHYPDNHDVWQHIHLPTYFSIETTVQCPAKCTMCPRSRVMETRKNKRMSEEMVKRILEQIDWKCFINWEWINDPLCDDRIYHFMNMARDKGIDNWITTTGYLLDEEKSTMLIDSAVDIVAFSVDTLNRELYKQVRGLDLNRVLENIERFINKKEQRGSKVEVWISKIQLPVTAGEDRESFHQYFTQLGANHVQHPVYRIRGGAMDSETIVDIPSKKECYFTENEMAITTDGNVVLCPCEAGVWTEYEANVGEMPLRDAWFTQRRVDLINLVRSRGLNAFKDCRELVER